MLSLKQLHMDSQWIDLIPVTTFWIIQLAIAISCNIIVFQFLLFRGMSKDYHTIVNG